ncbi:MAG: membrane protein insertion efficiency factor YidD [Thermodesulfobacteriota bacterium]
MRPPPENAADAPVDPLSAMVALYRGPLDHINAVRAGTCPMHPSCSTYALSATHKHGPGIGWTMAFDRLIRCGRDELKYAPEIPVNGNWRYHDPVSGNDFWWHGHESDLSGPDESNLN